MHKRWHSFDCYKSFQESVRLKVSKFNQGKNNGMWKGDKVGLKALHIWVINHKPRPEKCESCGKIAKLDLANISQRYRRDINDYEYLCRKCHMLKDGRIEKQKILFKERLRNHVYSMTPNAIRARRYRCKKLVVYY